MRRGSALLLCGAGLSVGLSACGGADGSEIQEAEGTVQQGLVAEFGSFSSGTSAPATFLSTHLSLTRNNKLLAVGGSSYNCCHTWGDEEAYLYDIASGSWGAKLGTPAPYGSTIDAFCSGHAHDHLGRVVFQGGLEGYGNSSADPVVIGRNTWGVKNSARYDVTTGTFTQLGAAVPHWYPTLVAGATEMWLLPGADRNSDNGLRSMTYGSSSWVDSGVDHWTTETYPRVHLLPNGKLFFSSGAGDAAQRGKNYYFDPVTNTKSISDSSVVPNPDNDGAYENWRGTAVLLPLTPSGGEYFNPTVAIFGASKAYKKNLGAASPVWTEIPRLAELDDLPSGGAPAARQRVRNFANSTLLPTGQVFISGGVRVTNQDTTSFKHGEVYDPATNSWLVTNPATVARNYHGVAILLPDGRVWIGSASKNERGTQCGGPSGCDVANTTENSEERVELFTPWYYSRADRPVIGACPTQVSSDGGLFNVGIAGSQGTSVAKVALMRAGSVTHAFDTDQRLIWLDIASKSASSISVNAPYSPTAAPPGDYMLFALRDLGAAAGSMRYVPSKACWVRVENQITKTGITAANMQAAVDAETARGYRVQTIDGFNVGSSTYFNVVFTKRDGVAASASWGLDHAAFSKEVSAKRAAGWRLTNMDSWLYNGVVHYGAVWDMTPWPGGDWQAFWGWAEADWFAKFTELKNQGYRPVNLIVTRINNQRIYSALMDKSNVGSWTTDWDMTSAEYAAQWQDAANAGRNLVYLNAYLDGAVPRFQAIWASQARGWLSSGHDLTSAALSTSRTNTLRQGKLARFITGYDNGSGSARYAAYWSTK